jgi:hypothetical protein
MEKLALLAEEVQIQKDEKAVAAQKLRVKIVERKVADVEGLSELQNQLTALRDAYDLQEMDIQTREKTLKDLQVHAEKYRVTSDIVCSKDGY